LVGDARPVSVGARNVKQKQIVWRGRANGEIQADKTNEEREEKLIGILKELFFSYPPAPASKS